MAEAILVYPYLGDMDIIRSRPNVPLPLIQAACKLVADCRVVLLDARIEKNWREKLERELAEGPLYVALSVISGTPVASALEISRFVKKRSNVPVVWGGHHPTLCPEVTLSDPSVDVVVIGEGEETLPEMTDRYKSGRSLDGVQGIWFKKNGRVVKNAPRPPVDLDSLPPTPYHLVDTNRYVYGYRRNRYINIETSRGCHNHCSYCYHTSGKGPHHFRAMDPDQAVLRVLKAVRDCRVDGVFIVDDNFFIDKERGLAFAKRLRDQGKGVPWMIGGVDVPSMLSFRDEELRLLEESGLVRIAVGAESGCAKTLKQMRKPQTADMLVRANRLWSRTGIYVYYSWMAGLPGETMDDVRETIRLMLQIIEENPRARSSPLYNFIPLPGTALWDEVVEKYGFKPPATLEEWARCDWNHVNVSYVDPSMKEVLNNLFLPGLFMDGKFEDYAVPWWVTLAARAYRPLARARMKSVFPWFPIEKWGARTAERLLLGGQRF